MKNFHLEFDCPIPSSLYLVIHPVACGSALILSSTLLWFFRPRLCWSVYITHHIFILVYTGYSLPKQFSALIICIDAIVQAET